MVILFSKWVKVFFPGSCLATPKKELPGPKDLSRSIENLLQADSDTPQGEGDPVVGCPLKPCRPGVYSISYKPALCLPVSSHD